jgi:hypothetical protein
MTGVVVVVVKVLVVVVVVTGTSTFNAGVQTSAALNFVNVRVPN